VAGDEKPMAAGATPEPPEPVAAAPVSKRP
jgi:hypothetical protein